MAPIHERLGPNCDTRNTLDAYRRGQGDKGEEAGRGYHPCRDERYNSGKDRSLSPDSSGTQASVSASSTWLSRRDIDRQ
jgi:hypothetical protein